MKRSTIALAILALGGSLLIQGCTSLDHCIPGETRCHNGVVQECHAITGFEDARRCQPPYTCHFDDPAACGTYNVACCR